MNDFLKFPLALVAIVGLATAGLSKVYLKTKDAIERQAQEKIQAALTQVLPRAKIFEIKKAPAPVDSYWVGVNESGAVTGLAFLGQGKGYSSTIQTMVGMDSKGIISGIKVLSQQETPGLGSRVEEMASSATIWNPKQQQDGSDQSWFQEQFTGLNGAKNIVLQRGAEWAKMDQGQRENLKSANAISALTGATISSEAALGSVMGHLPKVLEHFAGLGKMSVTEKNSDAKDKD